jgi:hypothetical protein
VRCEPDPRQSGETDDQDRRRRGELNAGIDLETGADEGDEEVDDDEDADESEPDHR